MGILDYIFGEQTISFYLGAIFFLLLGQLTNKIVVYNRKANRSSFKIWYWCKDNWRDVVVSIVLSFITIRFTDDIVSTVNNFAHVDFSYIVDKMFYYFALGLFYQTTLHWLRKKLKFIRSLQNADGVQRKDGVIRPDGTPLSGGKK